MAGKMRNFPERLRLVGMFVLAAGIVAGMAIYLTAPDLPDAGIDLEESKVYLRNLELYGGKANVLATDVTNWFGGLWKGKTLGITVACLGGAIGVLMLFVARHLEDGK